ncbi:MAG TPA: hypothetical protein VFB94_25445 [Acidimicrobiales bacterium]|nr:hypothetical protein [Acidimicrobiales bacterium]
MSLVATPRSAAGSRVLTRPPLGPNNDAGPGRRQGVVDERVRLGVVARELRDTDPDRANSYRELVLVIGRELRGRVDECDDSRDLRAVIDDLAKVLRALE